MKDAVPPRIKFQVLDGIDRVPVAQHVVPLEQLVQNDSIKKSSKPQSEKYSGGDRIPALPQRTMCTEDGQSPTAANAAPALSCWVVMELKSPRSALSAVRSCSIS